MNSKKTMIVCAAAAALSFGMTAASRAATVTGDPTTDAGWAFHGNSLQSGVYVDGSANYSFDTYSAGFTIQSGSNLEISDGTDSWQAGDTVVGVGGNFTSITADAAGWSSFSGDNAVNELLGSTGPKLQVKFGTAAATWSTSTVAPGSGNGSSGSSAGGDRVQVRTSGYFQATTPTGDRGYTWADNSGQLLLLDKDDHFTWSGGQLPQAARMIWNWDDTNQHVGSWELLLNVSLLERLNPSFAGQFPQIGDMAIMTVQNGDSNFTNALVAVPEPSSLALFLGLGGLALLSRRTRRRKLV